MPTADTLPVKNVAYVFYVALPSQADSDLFQVNPTLAAGDVKVQTDDGSLANITTLPTGAASSKRVKVSLSAAEMNGDTIWVQFSDAAGDEWKDVTVCLKTSPRGITDLAYPATSGRSMVVDAAGLVDANAVKVGPTGNGTAQTAGDLAALVNTVDDLLDTEVAAIKAKTDNLPADPADASDIAAAFAAVPAAVWNYLSASATTAGSIGKRIVDYLTGDVFARVGAPAGASLAADVAAIKTDTAATLADTGTDGVVVASGSKTGYSLAATGLDSITATEPSAKPTTFPGWVMWLVQRFRRSTCTSTTLLVKTEAGATVTSQTVADDGTTESIGAPS